MPFQATMTPLSVHYLIGGYTHSTFFSLHTSVSLFRRYLLAATPPAITSWLNALSSFDYHSIALLVLSHKCSIARYWNTAAMSYLILRIWSQSRIGLSVWCWCVILLCKFPLSLSRTYLLINVLILVFNPE